MRNIITVVLIVSALLVVVSILLQQKGSGLSGVFGGTDVSYLTKRGAEKFIFALTIISGLIFAASALLLLFIS